MKTVHYSLTIGTAVPTIMAEIARLLVKYHRRSHVLISCHMTVLDDSRVSEQHIQQQHMSVEDLAALVPFPPDGGITPTKEKP